MAQLNTLSRIVAPTNQSSLRRFSLAGLAALLCLMPYGAAMSQQAGDNDVWDQSPPSRTVPPGITGNRTPNWGASIKPMSESDKAVEVDEGRGQHWNRSLEEQLNSWLSSGAELEWFMGADSRAGAARNNGR